METLKLTASFITGFIFGFLLLYLINLIINKKGKNVESKAFSLKSNKVRSLFILFANGLGWLFATAFMGINIRAAHFIFIISLCLVLSIIDIEIRKIPNEIILLLFVSTISYILINNLYKSLITNVIGFAVGLLIFILPFVFKITAGGGDIKYAAAIGFCVGYPGIISAILIMSGALLIWLTYLLISKKGGLKTQLAMGSFMSIGFVITIFLSNIK